MAAIRIAAGSAALIGIAIVTTLVMQRCSGQESNQEAQTRKQEAENRRQAAEDKKWEEIAESRRNIDKLILTHVAERPSKGSLVLVDAHSRVVARLSEIAATEKPQYTTFDARTMAMEALGAMAADSGMPVLVKNIEFAPPMVVDEASFIQGNPAAIALWRAGFAGFPHIIHYLSSTSPEKVSDRAIELYADIFFQQCKRVVGSGAAATQLVQVSVENTSEVYNTNLKRLRDKLKSMETQRDTIGR